MKKADKIKYLLKSILNFFSERKCPYCANSHISVIDRKYLVTTLLKCNCCNLMFRHPMDSEKFNLKFYNRGYSQSGITTDLPSRSELDLLIKNKFANTNRSIKDLKEIIQAIDGRFINRKILDYGCSWGYTTWQLKDLGMIASGFEISKIRADYGTKNLNIQIFTRTEDIKDGPFDFIFSSHVIEHLQDLKTFINFCLSNLKKNGYLIFLSPNGSKDFKKNYPKNFHLFWGQVHPNMISSEFYRYIFREFPFYISSSPYNFSQLKLWGQNEQIINLNGGEELLCIVKNG